MASVVTTTEASSDLILGTTFSINTDEFVRQLYISIPVGLGLIGIYCILRQTCIKTWEVRRKYELISMMEQDDKSEADNSDIDSLPSFASPIHYPKISKGFFVWIWDVWTLDTNEFYTHAGFDALVFRLYLKGCLYICLAALPYALCVLLPVYATSEVTDLLPIY